MAPIPQVPERDQLPLESMKDGCHDGSVSILCKRDVCSGR